MSQNPRQQPGKMSEDPHQQPWWMLEDPRQQPWKAIWAPGQSSSDTKGRGPKPFFDQGQGIFFAVEGGFTPQKYSQLYKADAPANAVKVEKEVQIAKDTTGKHWVHFK